jgi:hypothetical protein
MKIFRYIVLTMAAILALSCVKEEQPASVDEMATLEYGVCVDASTKALGDGKTATHVWYALYRADGSLVSECAAPAKIDADRKAICPVTMAKDQDYKVVFLAMYYEGMTPAYTVHAQSKTVSMPTQAQANSDKYDLFYGVDEVVDFQGAQSTNVELTRVVAQMNFELSETAWNDLHVDQTFKSQIQISGAPASMNILNGTLGAAATISYAQTQIPAEGRNIGTAYCFASAAGDQKVEASIRLYTADGAEVKTTSATAVPVAANRQTNLKIN